MNNDHSLSDSYTHRELLDISVFATLRFESTLCTIASMHYYFPSHSSEHSAYILIFFPLYNIMDIIGTC